MIIQPLKNEKLSLNKKECWLAEPWFVTDNVKFPITTKLLGPVW
jgi:hypothetical protein